SVADVDIVLPDTSLYIGYRVVIASFLPATNGAGLRLLTSEDGGTTFSSGASDYRWSHASFIDNTNSIVMRSATGSSYIEIVDIVGNTGVQHGRFVVDLSDPSSTRAFFVSWQGGRLD